MKRLIPATIVLICIILICVSANIYVKYACKQTLTDIENYYKNYSAAPPEEAEKLSNELKDKWTVRKEKMALFVNHAFLDKTTMYINQLPFVMQTNDQSEFLLTYENIKTLLTQIQTEQKFALHSFY